jgi:uncharacterized membrane protein
MKKHLLFYLIAFSLVLGISSGVLALSFTPFQVPGTGQTAAFDINNKNQVVGTTFTCCFFDIHGFERFPNGSFLFPIDVPGAEATYAAGIDDSGNIVGTFEDANEVEHCFYRSKAGAFTQIDVPNSFKAVGTECNGINNLGEIVGSYLTTEVGTGEVMTHGFHRSASAFFSKINCKGAESTEANAINDKSQIVGECEFEGTTGETSGTEVGTSKTDSFLLASPFGIPQFTKFNPPGVFPESEAFGINNLRKRQQQYSLSG